jgi:hypothetical protein
MYKSKNERDVITYLQQLQRQKISLRAIASQYGEPITAADISRALRGQFSKTPAKRLAFGLPALALIPVCRSCGQPHPAKRCTAAPRKPRRRPPPMVFD